MTDKYRNLLLGCGHARDKRLEPTLFFGRKSALDLANEWRRPREWVGELQTLDYESPCKPDIVWNLNTLPWPLKDDHYDEVHAYEVLEHLGRQGDYRAFFETFAEVWRVLRPGGFLCATVPSRKSMWLWGDPGHTRAILPCTLVFLDQQSYIDQQGRTSMSDYRRLYQADFQTLWAHENNDTHQFVLQAVKPSRYAP
jgi:SAM-dependent methyltransferase